MAVVLLPFAGVSLLFIFLVWFLADVGTDGTLFNSDTSRAKRACSAAEILIPSSSMYDIDHLFAERLLLLHSIGGVKQSKLHYLPSLMLPCEDGVGGCLWFGICGCTK